jgi:tetratricopeptide (TPR) repeat protein
MQHLRKPAARFKPAPPTASAPVQTQSRFPVWLLAVLLGLLVLAVYGQTLRFEFINYDDDIQVYNVPQITNGLTLQGIFWAFTHSHGGHWIPLNTISHMLDCQLYGLNAGGHHLTNVLLHAASAVLLFLVLRRMTATLWPGAFVAAVFAVHPLHVESVAWVAERKDVLSGFFFMLTLWAYVRHVQSEGAKTRESAVRSTKTGAGRQRGAFFFLRSSGYWLSLLFFACGLMSKLMVATLPLVLLFLDYWPLHRFAPPAPAEVGERGKKWWIPGHLILEKIPMLGIILLAGLGILLARPENDMPFSLASSSSQTGRALLTPLAYLWQMIYPAGLSVAVPTPAMAPPVWEVTLGTILLAAISMMFFRWRRKHPCLWVGWSWYLVMLAPVLVLIGKDMERRADRYTYLPQIGLYLILAWMIADLSVRLRHRFWVLASLSMIILAALMICARTQTSYWKDSETLFRHALAVTENNDIAHENLGSALGKKGQTDEAIRQFQQAIRLQPNDVETHYDLATALFDKGQTDEAIRQFQEALRLQPDLAAAHNNLAVALGNKGQTDEEIRQYQEALRLKPDLVEAHNNLGFALFNKGQTDEAIRQYQEALRLKPDFAEAHNNLGTALINKGLTDEAIREYQEAIRLKPDFDEAHNNLGTALFNKGLTDEAIRQCQEAIRLKPDYAEAHDNLGFALFNKGRIDEAISQYQEALRLKPDFVKAHNNLGFALFNKGQTDEAISQYQEALRLKPDYAEAHDNLGFALFNKGQIDEAISHYEEAIRLKPDDVAAHENLGTALFNKGQTDEAIHQYQEAIRLKPDSVEAHNNLGVALGKQGRIDEAISQFQEVIRLKPDLVEAHQNLDDALRKKAQGHQ